MSAEDREVSASLLADTKQAGAKRRRWPDALKRELAAAAVAPVEPVGFLPVEVMSLPVVPPTAPTAGMAASVEPARPAAAPTGSIEVVLPGGVRVTITGMVEARTASAVLGTLILPRFGGHGG